MSKKVLQKAMKQAMPFSKLRNFDLKTRLLNVLKKLSAEHIVYKENPIDEDDCILIEFWMPSDPSKGEIRLKLFCEENSIAVGLDKSKCHKKMIKKTAEDIDKRFDESIRNILLFWKAEVN